MKLPSLAPRIIPVAVAVAAAAAAVSAGPASASAAASAAKKGTPGPIVKLLAAQRSLKAPRYGKYVYFDPGVYVATFGSPLEFDVRRANYSTPLTITQVIRVPGERPLLRPLPGWALRGWQGLRRFLRYSVRNASGKTVVAGVLSFCPNGYDPQRATPNSPLTSPFPSGCATNPFEKGMVWGLQRGWGVDAFGGGYFGGSRMKLGLGTYTMTVNVTQAWRRLLHVTGRDAVATVKVRVVKASQCQFPCTARPRTGHGSAALPRLPRVPSLANPPASVLPDLVPLPSWGIGVMNSRATKQHPAGSQLTFGATVWIGGHARLDVEGFRSHGSPVMKAYQYFWRNGRVVGRARAGTMGFDAKKGHDHWHFQQFAEYRLLNAAKSVVLRSQKVGFCIAPTDAIDLLLPHAAWQPTYTGFGGACGSPSVLSVQEMLPLGWGDTYFQYLAGQSFDVSNLPNGTYYIEIIANPQKVLHETNYRNDVSLRKVILGGMPGHRTVKVPAYHGIDPEH